MAFSGFRVGCGHGTDLVEQEGVGVLVDDDVVVRELNALGAPKLVLRGVDPETQYEALRRAALNLFVDDERPARRVLRGQ